MPAAPATKGRDRAWSVRRVGDLVRLTNGYPFDSRSFGPDGDLPLVRIRDLFADDYGTYVSGPIPASAVLRDGDIVIGMDGDFDTVLWRRGPAALNQRLCLLRPLNGVDARFVAYALPAHLKVINDLTYATTVKHLSSFDVLAIRLPIPEHKQQLAIADYLDAETARTDALVTAKRRLMAIVLARQDALLDALVSSQPDTSIRPDVGWLTRVPRHWPSVSLGLVADVFNGYTPEREDGVGEVAWTTSGDIDQVVITEPTGYLSRDVALARGLRIAPAGSIVVGLVGQGRTRGLSATLGIPSTLNQNVAAIVPRDGRLDSRYLALLLRLAYDDLRNGGRGGNQPALNCELLQAYRVPLAPIAEQLDLVARVEGERRRDAKLLSELSRSIELLLERRQALITAAVAGEVEIPGVARDDR